MVIKRVIRSFGYAFKGMSYAYNSQLNFRIHLVLSLLALVLGWLLHISGSEWLWILACMAIVLSAELLNTAIETLTDMVSPGYHEKAGHVKDVAAAAVTITALFAMIAACLIFIPKIMALFN